MTDAVDSFPILQHSLGLKQEDFFPSILQRPLVHKFRAEHGAGAAPHQFSNRLCVVLLDRLEDLARYALIARGFELKQQDRKLSEKIRGIVWMRRALEFFFVGGELSFQQHGEVEISLYELFSSEVFKRPDDT